MNTEVDCLNILKRRLEVLSKSLGLSPSTVATSVVTLLSPFFLSHICYHSKSRHLIITLLFTMLMTPTKTSIKQCFREIYVNLWPTDLIHLTWGAY